MEPLRIETYDLDLAGAIEDLLRRELTGSWLAAYVPQIFQICDELIKNALKSNYKFLLLWSAIRDRLEQAHPEYGSTELDEWLREVFFSGEDRLLEQHLARVADQSERIRAQVRRLLDLENRYVRDGGLPAHDILEVDDRFADSELRPLLETKRLAHRLQIHAHFGIERSSDQLLVTIANDSPILQEDVERISMVRSKFRAYQASGRQQEFFIENLDTSGGGHGLGYAIMDSILSEMNLDPERSLYLIAATRTMVLLVLPLKQDPADVDATRSAVTSGV